jgi:hypothetical protein
VVVVLVAIAVGFAVNLVVAAIGFGPSMRVF